MLPNINQALYVRFKTDPKKSGYRRALFRRLPVGSLAEIVQLGYIDVCRTLTGIGGDPKQSHSLKGIAEAFVKDLLTCPPASQLEFDRWHNLCCERCVDCSGMAHIHYGQAQKLLNMSLKYLYNEFAFDSGRTNRLGFPTQGVEQYFHLPIDNQS